MKDLLPAHTPPPPYQERQTSGPQSHAIAIWRPVLTQQSLGCMPFAVPALAASELCLTAECLKQILEWLEQALPVAQSGQGCIMQIPEALFLVPAPAGLRYTWHLPW